MTDSEFEPTFGHQVDDFGVSGMVGALAKNGPRLQKQVLEGLQRRLLDQMISDVRALLPLLSELSVLDPRKTDDLGIVAYDLVLRIHGQHLL